MSQIGLCAFCGAALDVDGNRTCRCRPRSNLERVVANATALAGPNATRSELRTSLREAAALRTERTH